MDITVTKMQGANPNASGQLKRDDSWTCKRCKWSYPNAKPSAKIRKNHKKKCGKIKGFEVQDRNGSSRGVSSEDNSSDDEKDNGPEINMVDSLVGNMSNLSCFSERSDSPPALIQNFPESEKETPEKKITISENGVSEREYKISAGSPQDFVVESENDYKTIEINLHRSQGNQIFTDKQNRNNEGISKSESSLSVNQHNVEGKSGKLLSLPEMETGTPPRTLSNQIVKQPPPVPRDSEGETNTKKYPSVSMIGHQNNGFINEILSDKEPAKYEEPINVSLPCTHDIETTEAAALASTKLNMDTNVTENVVLRKDGKFNIETSIPTNQRKLNTLSAGNSEAVQYAIDIIVDKQPKDLNETKGNEDLTKKFSSHTSSASHDLQMEVGSESEKASRLSVHHHLNENTSSSLDEMKVMQEIDVKREVLINQASVEKGKEVISILNVLDEKKDSEISQTTNCTSSPEKPRNVSETRADNDANNVDKELVIHLHERLEDNYSLKGEEIQRSSQNATDSKDCFEQQNPPPFMSTSTESASIPQVSSLGNVDHGVRLPAEDVPDITETSPILSNTETQMFHNTVIENGEERCNASNKEENSSPSLSKSEEKREEEENENGLLNYKGKDEAKITEMEMYSQEKMGSDNIVVDNPRSSMDLIKSVPDELIHSTQIKKTSDSDVTKNKEADCLVKGGKMEEDEKSEIIKEESVKNPAQMIVNSDYDGQKGSNSNRIIQKLQSHDDFFSAREFYPELEYSQSCALSVTFTKSSLSLLEASGNCYVDCLESLETCSVDEYECPDDMQSGSNRRLQAAMFSTQSGKNSFIQVQVNKSQSYTRSVEERESADSRMDGEVKENKEEDDEKEAMDKWSRSTAPNKEQGNNEGEELKCKSFKDSEEKTKEKRREEDTSNEPLQDMVSRRITENKQVNVKTTKKGSPSGSPINNSKTKPKKSPLWKICMCSSPAVKQ